MDWSPSPFEIRFWGKVNYPVNPDDCWHWGAAIDPRTGYGRIGLGRRKDGVGNAHKVAYELIYGHVDNGYLVCHKCHNRACVNPRHLYQGTHSDNIRDSWACGNRTMTPAMRENLKRARAKKSALEKRVK